MIMNRYLSRLAGVLCLLALASCGGGSSPPLGKTCLMNSECANPLSCTFGKCHAACAEARDCPTGQLCVKSPTGNVCQQAEETTCQYRSQCMAPLICAIDRKCRSQCLADIDCPTMSQKCVQPDHVCAEPAELGADMKIAAGAGKDPVPDFPDGGLPDATSATGGAGGSAPGPDGGAGAGGATGGVGGATGGAGGGSMMPIPVSGVMVDKPIVRQGETGINATVTATGGGLTGPTNIEVGGPMGCRGTAQDGGTDTMFVIRITCPHGTALGAKDLTFQTAKGIGMYPAVITVSAITASPTGMDTNRGTSDSPFRSFKKAIGVADKGDIVDLKDGMYDKDNGEDFKDLIPPGITIQGQSAAGTKLIGPTDASIYVSGIKLRESGALTVKNLTLGFFQYGIYLDKVGDLTLDNVKVTRSRNQGVYVYYNVGDGTKINWTGDDSEISDNGNQAVLISSKGVTFNYKSKGVISSTTYTVFQVNADSATVSLDGTTVTSSMMMPGAQALTLQNGPMSNHTVTLNNVIINGQTDIGGKDMSTATITGTTFNLPVTYSGTALDFTGAKLNITKSNFNGGGYHLHISSGEVTVRDTKFKDYYYYGVQVTTAKKVDLGNMTQPGNDDFTPGTMNAQSFVIRDDRAADPNPITVRDATVNGNLIPMMTYEGPGMQGPPKTFYIYTAKNQIIVY
jgi:Protein of unknown function (DUF1565)